MTFDSPDALNQVVTEVRAELEARGLSTAARRLAEVQESAYTTGSEWLGELGVAVQAVQGERGLTPELRAKLEVIRGEVRRVWPGL
jgi:hypothetical protein